MQEQSINHSCSLESMGTESSDVCVHSGISWIFWGSMYLAVDGSQICPIGIYVHTVDGNIWFRNLKMREAIHSTVGYWRPFTDQGLYWRPLPTAHCGLWWGPIREWSHSDRPRWGWLGLGGDTCSWLEHWPGTISDTAEFYLCKTAKEKFCYQWLLHSSDLVNLGHTYLILCCSGPTDPDFELQGMIMIIDINCFIIIIYM